MPTPTLAPNPTLTLSPTRTPISRPNPALNLDLDLPLSAPSPAATLPLPPKRHRKPWSPSPRDHLIFRWVTFQGHTQDWVAAKFGIHQTTVSRCLERYQRWVARGGPATTGSLSHEERLRYQRWLTYERNELVLGSALRIATEMENSLDVSKSVITRPTTDISQAQEIRTEHSTLDRSGTACRFLRLAHRINMDQLKLVEQQELDPLDPLTEDDFDPSLDEELDQSLTLRHQGPHPTPASDPDHLSFPGSNLGTHSPEAPASSADPESPPPPPLSPTPTSVPASVPTLQLTPDSSPVLKTHKTHTPSAPSPAATPFLPSDLSPSTSSSIFPRDADSCSPPTPAECCPSLPDVNPVGRQ